MYAPVREVILVVREVTLAVSVVSFSMSCVSMVHLVVVAAANLSR